MYFGFDPAKFTLNSPIFTGAPTSPTPPLHNNTDRIATMAALRAELLALGDAEYNAIFGKSLGASGYQKLPSGLIIQWGVTGGTDAGGFVTQTLPITFPNSQIRGVGTFQSGTRNAVIAQLASLTTNQITFFASNTSGGAVQSANISWLALGA